ncbi:MAG: hypothetical protein HY706_03055 [Candidatus Hydrogenedentes bacterium]|nr:hypothetical protein [Candidatus Hydrogenedentota bacterium]
MKHVLHRLAPAWANDLRAEGIFRMRAEAGKSVDLSDYFLVEDRKADVTIFVFSGLDGLFAGGPRFEFRNLFTKLEHHFNLVFVREIQGMFYHLAPDGSFDGISFYEQKVTEFKKRLGARYNIAMGFSAGGAASFYFGTRCGMDKIIAFAPGFPIEVWTGPWARLHSYFNLKKLLFSPGAYIEVCMLAALGRMAVKRFQQVTGRKGAWDILRVYRESNGRRPRATVIYGAQCAPDVRQARGLKEFPEVKLLPLPSGYHNVPGHLKQCGELGSTIVREIEELLAARAGDSGATALATS